MDWFPKHPTDYRNDTWHLTLAEHGAYNLLIDHYMLYESPLPNNDIALAGILGVAVEEWLLVKPNVTKHFRKLGEKLRHKRCDDELETAFLKRRDGKVRQKKHRKLLKDKEQVTSSSHVSNAPTDRTDREDIQSKKEAPENGIGFQAWKAAGLDQATTTANWGIVAQWQADGCTDDDILETIKIIRARQNGTGPPKSLNYYSNAIMEAKATRLENEKYTEEMNGLVERLSVE